MHGYSQFLKALRGACPRSGDSQYLHDSRRIPPEGLFRESDNISGCGCYSGRNPSACHAIPVFAQDGREVEAKLPFQPSGDKKNRVADAPGGVRRGCLSGEYIHKHYTGISSPRGQRVISVLCRQVGAASPWCVRDGGWDGSAPQLFRTGSRREL